MADITVVGVKRANGKEEDVQIAIYLRPGTMNMVLVIEGSEYIFPTCAIVGLLAGYKNG